MNKTIIPIFLTLYAFSCTNQENKKQIQNTDNENMMKSEIVYQKLNKNGILLGDNIKILINDSNDSKDISYLNKHSVDILGVSESFYKLNSNDDTCKSFKYVKIKVGNLEGVVNGDLVYELDINNKQNKQLNTIHNDIELIFSHNYVMKAFDNQMPTGCTNFNPVVLKNKKKNDITPIKLINTNEYYRNFDYLHFIDTDVAYDEIDKVYEENDKINLIWKRYAQDGSYVEMLIAIYKKDNEYIGEIIYNKKKE
ncbi:hypothetical protein AD998_19010 [bacterium 336/3]|nr:hypothetical protein AD998_19010 [bacterium 336/3]